MNIHALFQVAHDEGAIADLIGGVKPPVLTTRLDQLLLGRVANPQISNRMEIRRRLLEFECKGIAGCMILTSAVGTIRVGGFDAIVYSCLLIIAAICTCL